MGAFSFCFALCVLIPALEGQRFPRLPQLPPRPLQPLPKPPGQLSPGGNVPGNGNPLSGGTVYLPATQRPGGSVILPGVIKTLSAGRPMLDEIEDVIESSNTQSGADETKVSSLLVALMMWLTLVLGCNRLW